MALISAKTIITSVSLFHVTIAYFFLTNPSSVDNQALVFILGESMGMPDAPGFDIQSPQLAFLAAILIFIGFSDLVSLSMPDEVCLIFHWGTQAPLRFLLSLVFTFYVYLFGPSSPVYNTTSRSHFSHPSSHNPSYVPAGWGGDALKNRLFFTFMFVEMMTWFWIWVTLREERDNILQRKSRRRSNSHTM
ncbi:increased loss of mitochondrial DNA protein 1 [Dactylonectria macrodidyma]|uniref:Increased loss of mitochondrial DNA protein 1 n=1 Tax=Dactylonectria macrodidyma TaxID=307937 RepID=A0A9P9EAX7_9HYPO|nr:increased loss of mitochondrial DNA protein 1 [Dactylonectria macrodidyma]